MSDMTKVDSVQTGLSKDAPDHVTVLDISQVKNLQIGYQSETIYLYKAKDDKLTIEEYIGGLSRSEYFAKVSSNRVKTTVRYGRRESVDQSFHVNVFLPESFKGELQISTQYGSIITGEDWTMDRFAAETSEGSIQLRGLYAPRIRLATSVAPIYVARAEGFVDLHSVSGKITAQNISGGGRFATSSGEIRVVFNRLNNMVECDTLNSNIYLSLPAQTGLIVDGVSKRGDIDCSIEGVSLRVKPGNVKVISGQHGSKPFQKVKLSTINGNLFLVQK